LSCHKETGHSIASFSTFEYIIPHIQQFVNRVFGVFHSSVGKYPKKNQKVFFSERNNKKALFYLGLCYYFGFPQNNNIMMAESRG
jgi:hypothetical protein